MLRRVVIGLVGAAIVAGAFGAGYVAGTRADHSVVPNLLGLGADGGGQAAARRELGAAGLRVGKVMWKACAYDERGLVVVQIPPAGTIIPDGSTVDVAIGSVPMGLEGEPDQCLPGQQTPLADVSGG